MRVTLTPQRLRRSIVVLILYGVLDSCLLARSTVSFQTLGVTTSEYTRSTRECWWTSYVLGLPGGTLSDYDNALLDQIVSATNLALPTPDDPIYA